MALRQYLKQKKSLVSDFYLSPAPSKGAQNAELDAK